MRSRIKCCTIHFLRSETFCPAKSSMKVMEVVINAILAKQSNPLFQMDRLPKDMVLFISNPMRLPLVPLKR